MALNSALQAKYYIENVRSLVIGLAGNEVTSMPPSKDKELMLLTFCHRILKNGNLNTQFALDIQNKIDYLTPFFHTHSVSEQMYIDVTDALPKLPDVCRRELDCLWKEFESLKSDIRYINSEYLKKCKTVKSGTYSDHDIFLSCIKDLSHRSIQINEDSAKSAALISFKKRATLKNELLSPESIQTEITKISAEKKLFYNLKRDNWLNGACPKSSLLFLFCGAPARSDVNKLLCFNINATPYVPKDKLGRKVLKLDDSGVAAPTSLSLDKIALAKEDLDLKRKKASFVEQGFLLNFQFNVLLVYAYLLYLYVYIFSLCILFLLGLPMGFLGVCKK